MTCFFYFKECRDKIIDKSILSADSETYLKMTFTIYPHVIPRCIITSAQVDIACTQVLPIKIGTKVEHNGRFVKIVNPKSQINM